MFGRETISDLREALESLTLTTGEVTQLVSEGREALFEIRQDSPELLSDLKTAAQTATIAFVCVAIVATLALCVAVVALPKRAGG